MLGREHVVRRPDHEFRSVAPAQSCLGGFDGRDALGPLAASRSKRTSGPSVPEYPGDLRVRYVLDVRNVPSINSRGVFHPDLS